MTLSYKMQPIAHSRDLRVFGYELLYAGNRPVLWSAVDAQLMHFLARDPLGLPPLFINLANETLLDCTDADLAAAALANEVIFELSEAPASAEVAARIAARVNVLAGQGVCFAIDDFGSGLDGFSRLFALDSVAVIKIDGLLLRQAQERTRAADMLSLVLSHWRSVGILTVAECIETDEQLALARDLGFDLVQGFYVDTVAAHASALLVPARGVQSPPILKPPFC